ncbi:hypothetical protein JTE90_023835 [Oedothorax gibbosus]|uniref:Uncharacterized protein n=1 Tax=Oedothorax gibbosus TaxID=931172 RepID=A0AAV6VJF8_9ARAC|nr:hypothetical protein JTE90_023835 [Oedothorax gibbosus]
MTCCSSGSDYPSRPAYSFVFWYGEILILFFESKYWLGNYRVRNFIFCSLELITIDLGMTFNVENRYSGLKTLEHGMNLKQLVGEVKYTKKAFL